MRILLMNPSQVHVVGETAPLILPLGLAYLAAVLEKNGLDPEVFDCVGEAPNVHTAHGSYYVLGSREESVTERIESISPQILMITCCTSSQFPIVQRIASVAKAANPSIRIVLGGSHPSACPEECLASSVADFVVVGEGESVIVPLVQSITEGNEDPQIPSVCYRRGADLILNKKLSLPANLDLLPFPAWHLFPMHSYLKARHKHSLGITSGRVAEVITSRGCPNRCTYCASHVVHGRRVRSRSVDAVVEEIRCLQQLYGITEVHFEDDNITLSRSRFLHLCRELKHLNILWTVPNGLAVDHLDPYLLDVMKSSGCYSLFLAIESGNRNALATHVRKRVSYAQVQRVVTYARAKGFYLVGFFLMGFREESQKDITETIRFAARLGLDEAHFSIVTPLPGTEYARAISIRDDRLVSLSAKNANTSTLHLSAKKVEQLRNLAYLLFEVRKILQHPSSCLNVQQLRRITRYGTYLRGNLAWCP